MRMSGSFTIHYTVSSSFFTEGYSLKLSCRKGRLRLRTRNAPGIRRTGLERAPDPESPALTLPPEEIAPILDILGRVRISLQPLPEMDVTDSAFYRLELRYGDLDLSLRWYHELPGGWDRLKPLLTILEGYASTYGRASGQETDE